MNDETKLKRRRLTLLYVGLGVGGLALLIFLLWTLQALIPPLIMGALLAYLFRPLKKSLRAPWLPMGLRVVLIFCLIGGGLTVISRTLQDLVPDERGQAELMIRLKYKANAKYRQLMGLEQSPQGHWWYQFIGHETQPVLQQLNQLLRLSPEQKELFRSSYSPSHRYYQYFLVNEQGERDVAAERVKAVEARSLAPSQPSKSLAGWIEILAHWLVLPLVFIFLLLDNGQILHYFMRGVPNRYFELTMTVVEEFDQAVGRYLRGTLLECALVGGTLFVGLFLIGLETQLAFFIGLIAGLANAIPFLGPLMGLVIGLAYALIAEQIAPLLPFVTLDTLPIAVALVVAVAQVLDNVYFQPVILGGAVNLHPLVVIFGVIAGASAFGFTGMLLAIPVIVVCNVVVETFVRELRAYRLI